MIKNILLVTSHPGTTSTEGKSYTAYYTSFSWLITANQLVERTLFQREPFENQI